jgi:two-component system sensor histidine kinase AlgZ
VSDVLVRIERRGDRVHVRIENPVQPGGTGARAGNHMALDNIRERLMLFFDADARLDTKLKDGRYCVDLDIPYRAGSA